MKEGEKAMGGEILDYPAKIARREGREEGREEGQRDMIAKMLRNGMKPQDIVSFCEISMQEILEVQDSLKLVQQD